MLESNGIRIVFSFGGKVRVNQNDKEVESVNNFSTFRKWAKGILSDNQFKVAKAQYNRL
jgi:hypothetical protein